MLDQVRLSFSQLSFAHLHQEVDLIIGVALVLGACSSITVAMGWIRMSSSAARCLLFALALPLLVAGLDLILPEVLVSPWAQFSFDEVAIGALIALVIFGVLPWLSLKFVGSLKTIQALKGGLEVSERLAGRLGAEREVLSLKYIQSAEALRRSVEEAYRFAALVEGSRDAVIGVNEDGTVWHWNGAAEALFKRPAHEMVNAPLSQLKVGVAEDLWRLTQHLATRSYITSQAEVSIRCGDGTSVPVWISVSPVDTGIEGQGGYALIARNVADKKRVEESIAATLKEKDVLLKEVHHRVKNNLQLICSLLRLQSREASDDAALRLFRKSEDRVRSLALVHDKLYRSENLSSLNFGGYLTDLATQLVKSHSPSHKKVQVAFDVEDLLFPPDTAITCGLIVNELVGNSLKHARAEAPKMKVSLRSDGASITISIWDNGEEAIDPVMLERPTHLGFNLVKSLTHQLGGTITFLQHSGSEFRVSLPISVLRVKETVPIPSEVAA